MQVPKRAPDLRRLVLLGAESDKGVEGGHYGEGVSR
jgi:hypothetical protein